MPTNWTTKWPTEPGDYWLYGCPFEKVGGGSKPEIFLVHAYKSPDGIVLVANHSAIVYEAEAGKCCWAPREVPEPPEDF